MSVNQYLGSIIRLYTKSKIRYEGILYKIDTNNSSVTLAKVRSLGTEDQFTDWRLVLPSDHVSEYRVFLKSEIEELHERQSYPGQAKSLLYLLKQYPVIDKASAAPETTSLFGQVRGNAASQFVAASNGFGGGATFSSVLGGQQQAKPSIFVGLANQPQASSLFDCTCNSDVCFKIFFCLNNILNLF